MRRLTPGDRPSGYTSGANTGHAGSESEEAAVSGRDKHLSRLSCDLELARGKYLAARRIDDIDRRYRDRALWLEQVLIIEEMMTGGSGYMSNDLDELKRLADIARRELTAAHYIDNTRRMHDEVQYWTDRLAGIEIL